MIKRILAIGIIGMTLVACSQDKRQLKIQIRNKRQLLKTQQMLPQKKKKLRQW